jgi:hypothetical protein
MTVRSIADYLGVHPFFAGLDAASVQQLAGCARNEHVRAGGYLFRAGGSAEHFYVVMHGRIALELFSPGTGPLVVDSADNGEVLDWPWLIPPHQWLFDAPGGGTHERGVPGFGLPAREMRGRPAAGLRARSARGTGNGPPAAGDPGAPARSFMAPHVRASASQADDSGRRASEPGVTMQIAQTMGAVLRPWLSQGDPGPRSAGTAATNPEGAGRARHSW